MLGSVFHDTNNLAIRNLYGPDVITLDPQDKKKVISVDWEVWKLRMFTSIYASLFQIPNTRECILAVDDKSSWRYKIWPRYKEERKRKPKQSDIDMELFFKVYSEFMQELTDFFPIKVLKVPFAEGDDIIGTLVPENNTNKSLIISTDKDYLQLFSKNVKVYNPIKKEYMEHPNPEMFIIEQCMIGQVKDSIFNIVTPQDYPIGLRKPGFGPKAFEKAVVVGIKETLGQTKKIPKKKYKIDEEERTYSNDGFSLQERFDFNRKLMDFQLIPNVVKNAIRESYYNSKAYFPDDPGVMHEFFKKHNWPEYLEQYVKVEQKLLNLF